MWTHRLPDHLSVFPAEKKIVFPLKQSSLTAGQHKYVLEWKLTIKVNSSKAAWCLNWLGQATTLSAVADMKSLLSSGKCSTSHTNTCTSWGKIFTRESLLLHISSRHKNTTRADAAHQAHGCPLQVRMIRLTWQSTRRWLIITQCSWVDRCVNDTETIQAALNSSKQKSQCLFSLPS